MVFFFLLSSSVKHKTKLPECIQTVLTREMEPIYGNKDAKTLNEEFLSKNSKSMPHLAAGKEICRNQTFFLS